MSEPGKKSEATTTIEDGGNSLDEKEQQQHQQQQHQQQQQEDTTEPATPAVVQPESSSFVVEEASPPIKAGTKSAVVTPPPSGNTNGTLATEEEEHPDDGAGDGAGGNATTTTAAATATTTWEDSSMPLFHYSKLSGVPRTTPPPPTTSSSSSRPSTTTHPIGEVIPTAVDAAAATDAAIPVPTTPSLAATTTPTTTTTPSRTTTAGPLALECCCTAVAQVLITPVPASISTSSGVVIGGHDRTGSSSSSSTITMTAAGDTTTTTTGNWNDELETTPTTAAAAATVAAASTTTNTPTAADTATTIQQLVSSDLWKQPHFVMAVGWRQTGSVSLLTITSEGGGGSPIVFQSSEYAVAAAAAAAAAGDGVSANATTNNHPGSGASTAHASSPHVNAHGQLVIRDGPWNHPPPTVDVSMDSAGTTVAAIDQGGTCCVWELKYCASWRQQQQQQQQNPTTTTTTPKSNQESTAAAAAGRNSGGTASSTSTSTTSATTTTTNRSSSMFSNFMSALTGMPPSLESSLPNAAVAAEPTPTTTTTTTVTVPCLAASIVHASRITYPAHWKAPACLAVCPSPKSRSFVVGFSDGRLILTKRGGLFQRRNDTVLYQGGTAGTNSNSSVTHGPSTVGDGIQCVTWRSNLIAWADASGMKLLDVTTLTRIAHIDRPTGARPTLYPTLTSIRPHLVFDTSSTLLVAWGDCLMGLAIQEHAAVGEGTSVGIRRTVECTMAWELDCVAAGVVPLDADHVVVLGVVVPEDDEDLEDGKSSFPVEAAAAAANELEVQIVSRHDGTIQYADVLPPPPPSLSSSTADDGGSEGHTDLLQAAAAWQLLSSFQVPRMDNASEYERFKLWKGNGNGMDELDLSLLQVAGMTTAVTAAAAATSGTTLQGFVDAHRRWNLRSILHDDEFEEEGTEEGTKDGNDDEDASSVDSDDYGFVLRPLDLQDDVAEERLASPPTMVLASPTDLLVIALSTVDDAVEHALIAQDKPALALKRALQHRRQLRRYQVSDLVQHYLEALLQVSPDEYYPPNDSGVGIDEEPLSLRRMALAIQAMPVLLGGDEDQWIQWARELEGLPGALFILRQYLPVRDPILPPSLYEQVLRGMLGELERLAVTAAEENKMEDDDRSIIPLDQEAAHHFLDSLLAWGPTKALKEYIKLYQYSRRKGDKSVTDDLKRVEVALQRRYLQTAAEYLHFPVREELSDTFRAAAPRYDAHKDDSQDALYHLDSLLEWIKPRVPILASATDDSEIEAAQAHTMGHDNRTCLETMARLRVMQGQYDLALKAYLAIGVMHSPVTMDGLEEWALDTIQHNGSDMDQPVRIQDTSYEFVLGLIENHHLHRLLLDGTFMQSSKADGALSLSGAPLYALMRLVGLPRVGAFLMEHCVAPEIDLEKGPSLYTMKGDAESTIPRVETLPMDLVATELNDHPTLLHWYLHLVFTKKPELYVKFPNFAIPPKTVTDLHRRHFQLYLQYAGDAKDSLKALSGTDTYKVEAKTTPLLSFLKATLPLGGVSPIDARRQLETLRSEESSGSDGDNEEHDAGPPHSFALELAYIIEHFNEETEAEALGILDLYLEGANSIMLGVAYAQRQRSFSTLLWDKLISHCLSPNTTMKTDTDGDGMLFGALLEAAALSGANLARLVARIPPGMVVEGLRPRLVAAVADYRLKLDIHQVAASAASSEQVSLLREMAHRSRRGARYRMPKHEHTRSKSSYTETETKQQDSGDETVSLLPKTLRTVIRRERHSLSFSLPMISQS